LVQAIGSHQATQGTQLAAPALALIEQLREKRKGKWVFPGKVPGAHLQTVQQAWKFVRTRAQLEPKNGFPARPYDLRHSFASVGAAGGVSLLMIGKLLGHTQAATTQRYAHLADEPLRAAATQITSVIAPSKPSAKVIEMKR
jgi:site-specific recombinase XerD